jgi:hypothetical protein
MPSKSGVSMETALRRVGRSVAARSQDRQGSPETCSRERWSPGLRPCAPAEWMYASYPAPCPSLLVYIFGIPLSNVSIGMLSIPRSSLSSLMSSKRRLMVTEFVFEFFTAIYLPLGYDLDIIYSRILSPRMLRK